MRAPGRGCAIACLAAGLATLCAYAWAAEKAPTLHAIGDLAISYDPAAWKIAGGGDHFTIAPSGREDGRHGVDISIGQAEATACSQKAMTDRASLFYPDAWERHAETLRRPGFDVHVATLDMGCRNWTGSPVFACAAYRGSVYTFTADPGGCDTPPMFDGPVIDLLGALRARD